MKRRQATAVVFDLDSTIADTRHRHPMIEQVRNGEKTWDDYAAAAVGDTVVPGTRRLVDLLWPYHEIHVITGRPVSTWEATKRWLVDNKVKADYIACLTPDGEVPDNDRKLWYLQQARLQDVEVVLYVEDWPDTVQKVMTDAGVPALCVNPMYPDDMERGLWGSS